MDRSFKSQIGKNELSEVQTSMAASKLRRYFRSYLRQYGIREGDIVHCNGTYGKFHELSAYQAFSHGHPKLTVQCRDLPKHDEKTMATMKKQSKPIPASIDYKGASIPVEIDIVAYSTEAEMAEACQKQGIQSGYHPRYF